MLFDSDDDITRQDPSFFRCARSVHSLHEYTLAGFQIQLLRHTCVDVADLDAEKAALNLPEFQQIVRHLSNKTDGYGKRVTLIHTVVGGDSCINANEFTLKIDQSSTTIAGIDRGVGLDEGLYLQVIAIPEYADVSGFSAHDSCCDRRVQVERIANSEYPFSRTYAVGISIFDEGKIMCLNFQQRKVGGRVRSYQLGKVTLVVAHHDFNVRCFCNDVMVGHNIAIIRDDHA